MESDYLCPHCRGHLNVGDFIVFKIRNTRRDKGLLLLHPEVGNYTSIIHPDFHFEEGERVDFYCPICMSYLDADLDANLVRVVMVARDGGESEIYFSRIAGEQSSVNVSESGVELSGKHSHRYTHIKVSDRSMPEVEM